MTEAAFKINESKMDYANLVKQLNKVKGKEWTVSKTGEVSYKNKFIFIVSQGESFATPEAFRGWIITNSEKNEQMFLGTFLPQGETEVVFNVFREIVLRLKKEADDKVNVQRQTVIDKLKLV